MIQVVLGSRDRGQARDQKVAGSSPGRRIFFSTVNFLCGLPVFSIHSTPVKYPGHFTKSAGGWLQLNTPI